MCPQGFLYFAFTILFIFTVLLFSIDNMYKNYKNILFIIIKESMGKRRNVKF